MWTKNFQMNQLSFEEAKESEMKLPTFQKNIYFCLSYYIKAFDCVDHNKLENS